MIKGIMIIKLIELDFINNLNIIIYLINFKNFI